MKHLRAIALLALSARRLRQLQRRGGPAAGLPPPCRRRASRSYRPRSARWSGTWPGGDERAPRTPSRTSSSTARPEPHIRVVQSYGIQGATSGVNNLDWLQHFRSGASGTAHPRPRSSPPGCVTRARTAINIQASNGATTSSTSSTQRGPDALLRRHGPTRSRRARPPEHLGAAERLRLGEGEEDLRRAHQRDEVIPAPSRAHGAPKEKGGPGDPDRPSRFSSAGCAYFA